MHPRDRLKRNTRKNSIDDNVKYVGQFLSHPSNRLNRKSDKRPPIHPTERVTQKKENEIARKNLELESLDIETLKNQKKIKSKLIFHQERENLIIDQIREKVPLDNDDIYVRYNPENSSYELKTDNENDEKEYLIKGLYALNKKTNKLKDK